MIMQPNMSLVQRLRTSQKHVLNTSMEKTLETARRSKQSILKEINPEYSLEGLMLKLKLQYFSNELEKALMLGKIEGKKEKRVAEDEMVR